ncbi:hypothetical protein ACA910_008900 [Epithemia clementina (nom. ined.)]
MAVEQSSSAACHQRRGPASESPSVSQQCSAQQHQQKQAADFNIADHQSAVFAMGCLAGIGLEVVWFQCVYVLLTTLTLWFSVRVVVVVVCILFLAKCGVPNYFFIKEFVRCGGDDDDDDDEDEDEHDDEQEDACCDKASKEIDEEQPKMLEKEGSCAAGEMDGSGVALLAPTQPRSVKRRNSGRSVLRMFCVGFLFGMFIAASVLDRHTRAAAAAKTAAHN